MLTRCQFTSHISKVASTSQIISKACQSITSSSREPGPSTIRQFTKGATVRLERKSSTSLDIQWPTESWDDIFKDLDNEPFKPRRAITKRTPNLASTMAKPSHPNNSLPFFPRPVQRQTLTKRERDTLAEMVDMILKPDSKETDTQDNESTEKTHSSKVNSLIDRLRQYSRKQKKANLGDVSLDKKLEQISLCTTDMQLLEWAEREVFGESMRLAEQASTAIAEASRTKQVAEIPLLQSPLYPNLIAHLIRTFRVQYHDPHLALSIFDHAKSLSTLSFVFGCSTGAYNELIETQWMVSRNLEAIHASIEEMIVNGVSPDSQTRKLVEGFRQELFQTRTPADSKQVHDMDFLTKIEHLLGPTKRLKANRYEEWKSGTLAVDEMETFDDWQPRRRPRRSQSRSMMDRHPGNPLTQLRQ